MENEKDEHQETQEDSVQVEATEEIDPLEALQKELDDVRDKMFRVAAEAENTRKRAEKDIEDARKYGAVPLVRSLLDVWDNLKRALESVKDRESLPEAFQSFVEGVDMTEKSFAQAFQKAHVEPVSSIGMPFDPLAHQAVVQIPTNEHPPGTIAQVIQEGYRLHDRLLKPAMVGVAQPLPDSSEDR